MASPMLRGMGYYSLAQDGNNQRAFQARADLTPGFPGSAGGAVSGFAAGKNVELPMLEGILPYQSPQAMRRIYRDIYLNDPIAGAHTDLMCNLPFSDFSLTGIPSGEIMETFLRAAERVRIKSAMAPISADFFVDGAFLGVLGFDKNQKTFNSIMCVDLDFAQIRESGLFGVQPLIDITFGPELKKMVNNKENDPRITEILKLYPELVLKAIQGDGKLRLNAENTVYIPRMSKAIGMQSGMSLYRRIVATYIMEKAMWRGTIDLSYRRQKGILHLMIGDEDWEPDNNQLQQYADRFKYADADPTAPVIATRPGVIANELSSGDNFWKVSDIAEFTTANKMRSLGSSEAFLSGDANFNTQDAAITVFTRNLVNHREMLTRQFLYEKFFAYLSVANDFKKSSFKAQGELFGDGYPNIDSAEAAMAMEQASGHRVFKDDRYGYVGVADGNNVFSFGNQRYNIAEYIVPAVMWHNPLRPEGDAEYLEMLMKMAETGVPVPIRYMAAAGGLSIADIIQGEKEDLRLRKQMADYRGKISEIDKDLEEKREQMATGSVGPGGIEIDNRAAAIGRVMNREYDPEDAAMNFNESTGQRRSITKNELKMRVEKQNRTIARIMAKNAQKRNWLIKNGKIPGPKDK